MFGRKRKRAVVKDTAATTTTNSIPSVIAASMSNVNRLSLESKSSGNIINRNSSNLNNLNAQPNETSQQQQQQQSSSSLEARGINEKRRKLPNSNDTTVLNTAITETRRDIKRIVGYYNNDARLWTRDGFEYNINKHIPTEYLDVLIYAYLPVTDRGTIGLSYPFEDRDVRQAIALRDRGHRLKHVLIGVGGWRYSGMEINSVYEFNEKRTELTISPTNELRATTSTPVISQDSTTRAATASPSIPISSDSYVDQTNEPPPPSGYDCPITNNLKPCQRIWHEILSDELRRKLFVENVVNTIDRFNADGIALDYMYPGSPCGKTNLRYRDQINNFIMLLKELRNQLNNTKLISICMPLNFETSYLVEIARHVDLLNLVSYVTSEMRNEREPMYCQSVSRLVYEPAIRALMQMYRSSYDRDPIAQNTFSNKINLGISLYACCYQLNERAYKRVNNTKEFTKESFELTTKQPNSYTRQCGAYGFFELRNTQLNSEFYPNAHDGSSWILNPDTREIISYTDTGDLPRIHRIIERCNLGGVFVWSVDVDDYWNGCSFDKEYDTANPMLQTIASVFTNEPMKTDTNNESQIASSTTIGNKRSNADINTDAVGKIKKAKPIMMIPRNMYH